MTLLEMKKKVLGLIEELNPNSELLTDDPDIATKINNVINQVSYELARLKKIPKYVEIEVNKGDRLTFADIEKACGYDVCIKYTGFYSPYIDNIFLYINYFLP